MFNLDKAISEWRRRMARAGVKPADVLDELEAHLRDDVDQQMRAGLASEEAFRLAVQRIGQANRLKAEFEKLGTGAHRVRRIIKSLLGFAVVGGLLLASSYAVVKSGPGLGERILALIVL